MEIELQHANAPVFEFCMQKTIIQPASPLWADSDVVYPYKVLDFSGSVRELECAEVIKECFLHAKSKPEPL
jgi:hypothetical protein